ncbi:MAG: DUF885 domain-containing protein [Candidatus Aminicenantes bacterium]|nr:DUF885 domain-containing protein [Candidatus Aminicenantes bacterium]
MKKRLIVPLIAGALILCGFGILQAQQNGDDAKFTKLVNSYLEEYWKFYPTAATLAGFGKYDNKIEDFSESNVEKRGNAIDAVNKELVTKISPDKLSPDFQIDRQILLDALDYELFRLENLVPQEYNPLYYNEIFLHSIRALLVKNFSDAKLTAAIERAKALPGFIKFAKENLKTPPPEYTQAAIDQMPAILAFYKNDVPGLIDKGGADAKSKFASELPKVTAALEDWSRYLQNELLAKSTGNFRLGPEAHAKLLRLTGQTSLMTDELVNRSKADYNNIRREMAMVCIPFYRIMYPKVDLDKINAGSEDAARNMIIKGVLDKIKGDHVEKDAWVDKVKETAGEIKAFIEKTKLLDIPAANLTVEPMEPIYQGMTWLKFFGPAAYENAGDFKMQVQPIPASWPEDKVQSFLEEFNDFYLYFWTVERIYPGTFFPAAAPGPAPSILRKLAFFTQPLLAGWPLYTEEMFINAGFGEYDLRLRLNQLKLQLKSVIDFQMELNVHQGNYTKEQVVSYMTKGGFMSQAEAERKWDMLVLNPGYSYYPYAGYQEILDMEKDYKAAKGDAFDQKEFLNKLTSFGPLPIRLIKTKITQ